MYYMHRIVSEGSVNLYLTFLQIGGYMRPKKGS